MNNTDYERMARSEYQMFALIGKIFLILLGLLLATIPFLDRKTTSLWPLLFGLIFLAGGVLWIATDRRIVTEEDELENFLIETSRKISHVETIAQLVEEYRAEGADDLTLARIRGAPRLLRERGRDKISRGIAYSAVGLIFVCASIIVMTWKGGAPETHLLKYGFLGAGLGLGHIAEGIRLRCYARRFGPSLKPPVAYSPAQAPIEND